MNITKYPQFQLYLLTLKLAQLKQQIIPKNCDERCINSTIINRAYYSAYLMCQLWLEETHNFKPKSPWDFEDGEEQISSHKQIRNALINFGERKIKTELHNLFDLRSKADYNPFVDITPQEVTDAIKYMENIIHNLEFN
ncbi:MAG: HEPN domain-containing protein [Methanobrevibacter sp.]|uniref:HEPN domain-containing protein n=1 Tax=Methanobrevibacter sp. TaxID=66852 RepID=UPI0025CDB5A1|nr:HEPN domain-containing protein [Methanobrevibacter sp.]MBQ6100439.1 HEPN domain-containing protein [Methanobrevibacter sp.]